MPTTPTTNVADADYILDKAIYGECPVCGGMHGRWCGSAVSNTHSTPNGTEAVDMASVPDRHRRYLPTNNPLRIKAYRWPGYREGEEWKSRHRRRERHAKKSRSEISKWCNL